MQRLASMKGRWWIGIAAGVVLGIGTVAAVEIATKEASAQAPVRVTASQLTINQRISQAAVRRSNSALQRVGAVERRIAEGGVGAGGLLWAASNGSAGESLAAGRAAGVTSIFREPGTRGRYTVKFVRSIAPCTWSATIAADDPSQLTQARDVRTALDLSDAARTQLQIFTSRADGSPANSPFQVQVFC